MKYWLVMPAAGAGRRFGDALPKQYAQLLGRSVIEWSLQPFLDDPRCQGITVALAEDDPHWHAVAVRLGRAVGTVAGGSERSGSVLNALRALAAKADERDWVLVHDAARPCLPREDLDRLVETLKEYQVGGLLAAPCADTLKFGQPSGGVAQVERTVDRTGLWRALTPQMFRFGALRAALEAAAAQGRNPTDEAQALEWVDARVALVPGSAANLKITTAPDLTVAAAVLGAATATGAEAGAGTTDARAEMRIGSGFDVHAFGEGDFVMLGGVRVPYSRGIVAHSDGDVILHALCDALLGATGLGDIGQHFSDADPQWRGADSTGFVRHVLGLVQRKGFAVVNTDITVMAEAPRLSKYREEIRTAIASLLKVAPDCVNVKATTTEKMGFLGRSEGIAAQAVVLLKAL